MHELGENKIVGKNEFTLNFRYVDAIEIVNILQLALEETYRIYYTHPNCNKKALEIRMIVLRSAITNLWIGLDRIANNREVTRSLPENMLFKYK